MSQAFAEDTGRNSQSPKVVSLGVVSTVSLWAVVNDAAGVNSHLHTHVKDRSFNLELFLSEELDLRVNEPRHSETRIQPFQRHKRDYSSEKVSEGLW